MSDVGTAPTSPWSSPAFRPYLIGDAVSRLGNGVVPVTFAFAALEVAPDGRGIPMVLLALWITRVVFLAPGGNLPDRHGQLPVMIAADVVRLLAQVFPALTFATGNAQLWHLIASAAIYGGATAFFVPGAVGLLPRLVPPSGLQRANAWLDVVANTGRFVGHALATLLVVVGGIPLALFFDAGTFVVSLLALAVIGRRMGGLHDARTEAGRDGGEESSEEPVRFLDAVRIMPQLPLIFGAIIVSTPLQIGMASVAVLGPIVAEQRFDSVEQWGVIATCLAAGGLLGALISGRVHGSLRGLLAIALLALSMPAQLLALAYAPTVVVLAGTLLLAEVAASIAGVTFDTLVQLSVPQEMLSRVGSLEQTLTTAMVPLGIAIALPLANLVGQTTYLVGLSGTIVATAVGVVLWAATRSNLRDQVLAEDRGIAEVAGL